MIENDLDKVLNYMKRYVENVYEHDSEIMLNWKDIKLVLEEIERLNNIINDLKLCNSDYYNQINTLSSKISLILERLEYEETNTESLKEDIIEIIFNKQITLGSDKE